MSYTRGQLALFALTEIGIADNEFDVTPEMRQAVIAQMDMMLAKWSIKGIRLSFPISKEADTLPTDDSNIPDWAWEAVVKNLAILIAPSYGKQVSIETRFAAKDSYNTLCSVFSHPKELQFSSMPKGAGYKDTNAPFTSKPGDRFLTPNEETFFSDEGVDNV